MDDSNLELWNRLDLKEIEDVGIELPEEVWDKHDATTDLLLVGRVLGTKSVNLEALNTMMSKAWSPGKGIETHPVGNGRFIFIFKHPIDRKRALEDGPWSYDRRLVVLNTIKGNENPNQVILDWCDFSVMISGLSVNKSNKTVAESICNRMGRFKGIFGDKDGTFVGGSMMSRVSLNITEPLVRVMRVRNNRGEATIVSFKYEKLPNYCYHCGLLSHVANSCDNRYLVDPNLPENDMQFGPWLRAPMRNRTSTRSWQEAAGVHVNSYFNRPMSEAGKGRRITGMDIFSPASNSKGNWVFSKNHHTEEGNETQSNQPSDITGSVTRSEVNENPIIDALILSKNQQNNSGSSLMGRNTSTSRTGISSPIYIPPHISYNQPKLNNYNIKPNPHNPVAQSTKNKVIVDLTHPEPNKENHHPNTPHKPSPNPNEPRNLGTRSANQPDPNLNFEKSSSDMKLKVQPLAISNPHKLPPRPPLQTNHINTQATAAPTTPSPVHSAAQPLSTVSINGNQVPSGISTNSTISPHPTSTNLASKPTHQQKPEINFANPTITPTSYHKPPAKDKGKGIVISNDAKLNFNLVDIPLMVIKTEKESMGLEINKRKRSSVGSDAQFEQRAVILKGKKQSLSLGDDISADQTRSGKRIHLDKETAEAAASPSTMNCLSWNCQGVGAPWKFRILGDHIREQNPQIVFLSETKSNGRKIETIKKRFNFFGVFVEARGLSGGLALLWNKELNIDVQSMSTNHIDAIVYDENNLNPWRFTGFYGEPDGSKRKISWDLLRLLSGRSNLPWVCCGDYNALLSQSEKNGGNMIPNWQLRDFRDCLQDSGLIDLGFHGFPYTWCDRRIYPKTIRERLDRGCATDSWINRFPHSQVVHLQDRGSDHLPILLKIRDSLPETPDRKQRRFMFESMWLNHEECSEVVENTWLGLGESGVWSKLDTCRRNLANWSYSSFGNVNKKLESLRKHIDRIRKGILTEENKQKEIEVSKELEETLDRECHMWQQRAKAIWMRDGDRNTKYFHKRASNRRKTNRIEGLRNSQGTWCKTRQEKEETIVGYFRNIFTSNAATMDQME